LREGDGGVWLSEAEASTAASCKKRDNMELPRAMARWDEGRSTAEAPAMFWKVRTTLSGNDDTAVLSRREMLAKIGITGVCAVAGPAVFASTPTEARVAPVAEPISDAPRTEAAEHPSDTNKSTEFSSQDWRRRRWGRRRSRVVCRRYWRRGRRVRVCRRVWY
jgi:hypothetical protein